jgi:hypothetical protein
MMEEAPLRQGGSVNPDHPLLIFPLPIFAPAEGLPDDGSIVVPVAG